MSITHLPRWRRALGAAAATAVVAAGTFAAVPAAQAADPVTGTVSDARLTWGVKESFRKYLLSPIAQGAITPSGGVTQQAGNGLFDWAGGTGQLENGTGSLSFPGTVHFTGHSGQLDVTFAHPTLHITSSTTGLLRLDAKTKAFGGSPALDVAQTDFANVTFSPLTVSSGKLELQGVSALLTANGAKAFAGFYSEGTALDPASATGTFTAPSRFNPQTTVNVTSADATDGLKLAVGGTGYLDLPKASTGKDAVGVYAAVIDRSAASTDVNAGNTLGNNFAYMPAGAQGVFNTTVSVPTAKLSKDAPLDVIIWSAHGNPTADNVIYRQPLTLSKAQRDALFPAPAATPSTEHAVKSATAQDGLVVNVNGKDYSSDLVNGVYVGIVDRSKATGSFGAADVLGANWARSLVDNGFSQDTKAIAADTLNQDASYDVVVWKGHTNPDASTVLYREALTLTPAQRQALFPTVVEPEKPVTGAVTVTGKGFTKLPLTSTGKEANGVYVAAVKKGTDLSTITMENMHDATVGEAQWVPGALISQGAFSTTLNIPAGTTDPLEVITWVAHGLITPDTLLGRQDLTGTSVAFTYKPGTGGNGGGKTPGKPQVTPLVTNGNIVAPRPKPTVKPAPQVKCTVEDVSAVSGTPSLSWGVKSSFRSYVVGGIAKGSISTANGATSTGDGFLWGSGTGSLDANGLGTLSFPGQVNFSGHDGLLNTTISGVRVQITGAGTGVLVANVSSQDMERKDLSASNITFATLSFGSLSQTGGSASATLTAEGARAFAGFYSAGQALDGLTVSMSGATGATTKQVCRDAAGNLVNSDGTALASTGAASAGVIGVAGMLLLLGTAAVTLAARRQETTARH
ncbi:HtaA domain-containing protein [Arthrobacter woluwensis]|uniref:Htaa protein n=1 Tax=Arthrobacter woluwensis TaxID=156980 RepID=A0A1H4P9U0_9MICC|nr:HtaA domain-containing protein [Arthrobacter woluwensis]SEC04180.1 Htaa protein [Arthrobacter woluwensis]